MKIYIGATTNNPISDDIAAIVQQLGYSAKPSDEARDIGIQEFVNLKNNTRKYDAAIIIFNPDDAENEKSSIYIQYATFIGALGFDNVFLCVYDKNDNKDVPSELRGLYYSKWSTDTETDHICKKEIKKWANSISGISTVNTYDLKKTEVKLLKLIKKRTQDNSIGYSTHSYINKYSERYLSMLDEDVENLLENFLNYNLVESRVICNKKSYFIKEYGVEYIRSYNANLEEELKIESNGHCLDDAL